MCVTSLLGWCLQWKKYSVCVGGGGRREQKGFFFFFLNMRITFSQWCWCRSWACLEAPSVLETLFHCCANWRAKRGRRQHRRERERRGRERRGKGREKRRKNGREGDGESEKKKENDLLLCTYCVLHFMQHEAGGLFPKKRKGGNYALINSNIIICLLWQHPATWCQYIKYADFCVGWLAHKVDTVSSTCC